MTIKLIFRPWHQVIEVRKEVTLGLSIRHDLEGECFQSCKNDHPWYWGIWLCLMLFEIGVEFHFPLDENDSED